MASGGRLTALSVDRFDDVTGVTFTIQATAEKGGVTRTAEQTVRVAGALFEGFECGILANNINGILCHAEFRNLDLEENMDDPTTYGEFDRIKIASLESLLIRTNEAASNLAGSTYTRGRVYDKNGNELGEGTVAASSFNTYEFSADNGKLTQGGDGSMTQTSLANAGTDGEGNLEQFANLYLDYPSEEHLMTDGNLPTRLPAPFPDDDGDRYVSDTEFDKVMNSANGYIQFESGDSGDGSIQGGVAYGVPEGGAFSGTELPTASNRTTASHTMTSTRSAPSGTTTS